MQRPATGEFAKHSPGLDLIDRLGADVTADPDFRGYHHVIPLGEKGPTLVAGASPDRVDDYLLARAVLDRIMASFSFAR